MASEDVRNFLFSSFSSREIEWKYDVFLSFRGEDTRNKFAAHLYAALDQKRLITFMDDERLVRGKSIAVEILKAIERSRLSIVILSKNYASSTWCLEELAKIIECNRKQNHYVVPIFYHVDPSDVRKQKGDFGRAFSRVEQLSSRDRKEKVQRWREALIQVANLSGWHLQDSPEANFIKTIVDSISRKLLQNWKYEVFLSFRDIDTGNKFTDHLYSALTLKEIVTFRDEKKHERKMSLSLKEIVTFRDEKKHEREMPSDILEAIELSRLSIIILSKNYASSTSCLDQLEKIVECMETKNQTVTPIFYDIDPSEVRKQKEDFKLAFDKYDEEFSKEQVQRWRKALTEVGSLSGWHLQGRSEAKFIKDIVEEIWRKLRGTFTPKNYWLE